MGLALAQTLSYMSFMPEKYMAINSMGIGCSGIISLLIYLVLLLVYGDKEKDFMLNMIFYGLNFILMTAISCIYFAERKSEFAQYFIKILVVGREN